MKDDTMGCTTPHTSPDPELLEQGRQLLEDALDVAERVESLVGRVLDFYQRQEAAMPDTSDSTYAAWNDATYALHTWDAVHAILSQASRVSCSLADHEPATVAELRRRSGVPASTSRLDRLETAVARLTTGEADLRVRSLTVVDDEGHTRAAMRVVGAEAQVMVRSLDRSGEEISSVMAAMASDPEAGEGRADIYVTADDEIRGHLWTEERLDGWTSGFDLRDDTAARSN